MEVFTAILFTQEWDIIERKEREYAQFISETYLPATTPLGLESVGA